MKIVDISEFYSTTGGGVRSYVDHKFKAAARHGHSLTVIAPGKENRVERRGAGKLVWVESPQLPFDRNYRMFWSAAPVWRILDDEMPDLVEGSSPWRGGWIAAGWRGHAAKMLFMHADPVAVYPQTLLSGVLSPAAIDRLFGWYWAYLRRLNSKFDGCVVAGGWLADRFANYGLRNLHVVPFGVDTAAFHPGLRDEAMRTQMLRKCGLGPDATLLVNVGRHHPEKRVGVAIRAVAKAQEEKPVGLFIIGDGLIHGQVRALAAKTPHVHLAGWVGERRRLARKLASADALIHCSTAETFGFAVAEAMCCGTPVIAPTAGGAGALAGAEWSETYAPGDPDSAARAIHRLLSRDRVQLSAEAAQAGHGMVGDIESHFDRLFTTYTRAVRDKGSRAGVRVPLDEVVYGQV